MSDGFDIPINFPLNKAGAVHADDLLKQIRQQIKGVSDETKTYNAWLEKNAKQLGDVSKAQADAANELERYQATLEKMHQTQVMETASKKEGVKWTQSAKEGQADLSRTLATLQGNVVTVTQANIAGTDSDIKRVLTVNNLKNAAKGLSYEFPILAQAINIIRNPIVATFAAAAGAVALFKLRVDEATRSMGGIELPDVTEGQIDRINRFAEKFAKLGDHTAAVATGLDAIQSRIEADASFWRALGIDLGTGPEQAKADVASDVATGLESSAAANRAAGRNIPQKEMADLLKFATAAEATLNEQKPRMEFLDKYKAGTGSIGENIEFVKRYGFNTTYDEAVAMEGRTSAAAQAHLSNYENALEKQRLHDLGTTEAQAAQQIRGNNFGLRSGIANTMASDTNEQIQKLNSTDPLLLANAIVKIGVTFQKALDAAEKTQQEMDRKINANNQR